MPSPEVRDEKETRWIIFSRPARLNALRTSDITAATEAVQTAPETTRCLVLAGTGTRAFSSGMHLG